MEYVDSLLIMEDDDDYENNISTSGNECSEESAGSGGPPNPHCEKSQTVKNHKHLHKQIYTNTNHTNQIYLFAFCSIWSLLLHGQQKQQLPFDYIF